MHRRAVIVASSHSAQQPRILTWLLGCVGSIPGARVFKVIAFACFLFACCLLVACLLLACCLLVACFCLFSFFVACFLLRPGSKAEKQSREAPLRVMSPLRFRYASVTLPLRFRYVFVTFPWCASPWLLPGASVKEASVGEQSYRKPLSAHDSEEILCQRAMVKSISFKDGFRRGRKTYFYGFRRWFV